MNFKILPLIFLFVFAGCSDFLKGKKTSDQVITVEENEACLKKFPEVFERYIDSKVNSDEIDQALGCLNSTLTRFQTKFRGQQSKDVFSIDDITTIFNFFFKDLKISKETSEKLVKFKFALIGGEQDSLSKVDVDHLKEFLKDLSVELKNISKWVAVFRADNGALNESSIKAAYGQLRTSLINLVNSGHISKTQYSVEDFLILLKQFNFNLKPYSEQIDQLLIVKKFLIGDDYVRSKDQYTAAVELIIDIMELNAMIENRHFKIDFKNPKTTTTQKTMNDLVRAVIQIVRKSPRMKTEGRLRLVTLKELVKFESPLLTFQNLLLIKQVVFGGSKEDLLKDEVDHFEKKSEKLVDLLFKVGSFADLHSIDQFLKVSPELQSVLGSIFDLTFAEKVMESENFSEKIYSSLYKSLQSQSASTGTDVDVASAFEQIADAGTFKSKSSLMTFLKVLTHLLNLSQEKISFAQQDLKESLNSLKSGLQNLQELLKLKEHPTVNIDVLMQSLKVASKTREEISRLVKIIFPQIDLAIVTLNDLERIENLISISANELKNLLQFPSQHADFENFKKSLKTVLSMTEFYSAKTKAHDVISVIVGFLPNDIGPSSNIEEFLKLLVADREIKNFEDVSSVLGSLFSAYQLSQKLAQSKTKLGLDAIQDFVSVLMVSDALRFGKQIQLDQLIDRLKSIPQAKAALPQIDQGMTYLKILFPSLSNGVADRAIMQRLFTFIFILSQVKEQLAVWPDSSGDIVNYKAAIEKLLAASDFYESKARSHAILKQLMSIVTENSPKVTELVGSNSKIVLQSIQLLISDRELKSFADLNSILDTVFAGLDLYQSFVKNHQGMSLSSFKQVLDFLLISDQMQNQHFLRFDLALMLLSDFDRDFLKDLDMTSADLFNLKSVLIGGSPELLTLTEVQSLRLFLIDFEKWGSSGRQGTFKIDSKKMIQFLTKGEASELFEQIFGKGTPENSNGLLGSSTKVIQLVGSILKAKSAFEKAAVSRDFTSLGPVMQHLTSDLIKLPVFASNGTVHLGQIQKKLQLSLGLDFSIPVYLTDLKRIILGGTADQISRQDLLALQTILGFVQQNFKPIENALKVLYFDKHPVYSLEEIDQAAQLIKIQSQNFLRLTQIPSARLTWSSFLNLIRPLMIESGVNIDLQLIHAGHQLLVNSYFDYSVDHFHALISTYVDVLQVIRYSQMGFVKLQIKERSEFLITMNSVDRLFKVFENSIAYRVGRQFETKYLDTVLEYLLKNGVIPYQVSIKLFSGFYKRMLNSVFSNPRIDSDRLDAITEQQFIGLKNELILFKFFIHVIEGANNESQYSSDDIVTKNKNLKWSIERQIIKYKSDYQKAFSHDPQFFKRAIQTYRNEIMFDKGIMFANGYVISHNQPYFFTSWADQIRAQYIRTLARLLIQGWGLPNGREIDTTGLVKWYADFRDFSVAIKTFDPRSGNSGERSMLEANLFTYSGNGDDRLNFLEATQYIALLMTGGSSQFNFIYELAKKANCLTNKPDPVGASYVKESCVLELYAKYYDKIFANLNWFIEYVKELGDFKTRYQFFFDVMLASKNSLNKTPDLESLDLRTMNMIVMYTESIFSVLDKDQNDTLSPNEIRAGFSNTSYARFEKVIFEMAQKSAGKQLDAFANDFSKGICRKFDDAEKNKKYLAREAFIYLIYNGKMPEQKDIFVWRKDSKTSGFKGAWNSLKETVKQTSQGLAETAQTVWNCGVNDELFKYQGEVDRKMMINTFKLLKTVLASEK